MEENNKDLYLILGMGGKRDLLDKVIEQVKLKFELTEEQASQLFVAGGAIRSMILNEEVKDYDIFIENQELKAILLERAKENSCYISDNAITYYSSLGQIQIITTKTGFPWEIIDEFDFVMNQNYYYKSLQVDGVCDGLYITDIDTILAKKLKINLNCRNKLGTLARLSKFLERGYLPPDRMGLLSLGVAISKLEPITTLTELVNESKLYLSLEDVSTLCTEHTILPCSEDEVLGLNNRGSRL